MLLKVHLKFNLCCFQVLIVCIFFPSSSTENEMNGMTVKDLEKEKMTVGRMCFELKAKRQVTRNTINI